MSRTRRIAATAVIVASATLGVAGVANASENRHGNDDRGHGGYSRGCQYNNHDDNRYGNRYDNRDRHNRDRYDNCGRYERGLIADVLHLVGNIL